MALIFKGKEIALVSMKGHMIDTLLHKGDIIFQAIRSCFGKGFWKNDKPWKNTDVWKNH